MTQEIKKELRPVDFTTLNTPQEVFDAVVGHLRTQGEPAYNESGCVYRTENGLMCAVGCLIPNSVYKAEMEDKTVKRLSDEGVFFKEDADFGDFVCKNMQLLRRLQWGHDTWVEDCTDLDEQLVDIAKSLGLKFTPSSYTGSPHASEATHV